MLQELDDNELTLAACLLSCVKHSKENIVDEHIEEEESGETTKKVLVYFKRKEYNDEHFDLKDITQLNGKTILFAASNIKSAESTLVNTLKIYGFLLFKKFDEAIDTFEEVFLKENGQLYKFLIDELNKASENLTKDETAAQKYEHSLLKWTDLKALCANDNGKQIIDQNIITDLEGFLNKVNQTQTDKDMIEQKDSFVRWQNEQKEELAEQIRNFNVEFKKANILERLNELEKEEEILTFFDKKQEILNSYHNLGFANEDPANIPIEPEESEFQTRFEKHFKPYQKYANRPEHTLRVSNNKKDALESLRKIYLNNSKAQTNYDQKLGKN